MYGCFCYRVNGIIVTRHLNNAGSLKIPASAVGAASIDPTSFQMGWDYVTGTAATVTGPTTKTFPTTMTVKPRTLIISTLGYKLISSGVPTNASDFSADSGNYVTGKPISSSQYSMAVVARDAAGTVGNNVYIGYAWLAIV